jgi:hypothetical protein
MVGVFTRIREMCSLFGWMCSVFARKWPNVFSFSGDVFTAWRPLHDPGLVARKTPHLLLAKSPEFSSPLGEGEEARPFEVIDTSHSPPGSGNGLREVRQEGSPSGLRWVANRYLRTWMGLACLLRCRTNGGAPDGEQR